MMGTSDATSSGGGAGLAAPVFSLATEQSVGVGEFLDLIPLVDLTAAAGLHLIQVGRWRRVQGGMCSGEVERRSLWVWGSSLTSSHWWT